MKRAFFESKLKFAATWLTAVLFMSGCAKEQIHNPNEEAQQAMAFTVTVPMNANPATRALTQAEEDYVKTIDILLFDPANSDKAAYRPINVNTFTSLAPESAQTTTRLSFSAKVPVGNYNVVIVANARDKVTGANIVVGTDTKADVMARLKVDLPAGGWKTNPANPDDYKIPMWGERNVTLSNGGTVEKFPLHRMVAKVDVLVSGTDAETGNFDIKEIYIYNYEKQGLVAPDPTKWDASYTVNTFKLGIATDASTIAGQKETNPANRLVFNGAAITQDGSNRGKSCMGNIYLFESVKATVDGDVNAICVVLKAEYNGTEGYYRVDIAKPKTDGTNEYHPLLRNHRYYINIEKVTGKGWGSANEALIHKADNIKTKFYVWNEFESGEYIFDGQHMLGVSQSEFEFAPDEVLATDGGNKFFVETSVPQGWKIEKIVDGADNAINVTADPNSWLFANVMAGNIADTKNEVTLTLTQNNGAERIGYIHLTSGRMGKTIKVTQGIKSAIKITAMQSGANIEELVFAAAKGIQPAMQNFDLDWSPTNKDAFVNIMPTAYPAFNFNGAIVGGTLSASIFHGHRNYSVRPPAITDADMGGNAFFERQSEVQFSTIYDGQTVDKTVLFKQYVPTMVPTVESLYFADGGDYTFNVKSNRPWRAFLTNAGNQQGKGNMITAPAVSTTLPFATGNYNLPGGTNVGFSTVNDLTNPTILSGTGKVRIEWLSGTDESNSAHWTTNPDIDLNCTSGIIQPKSNSYIVAPGGIGILIPVSRANESMLGAQLGVNEAFTAELVWTDNANRIAANSNIKMIRAAGRGTGGYVLVVPGSESGNAVVAIRNAANKILWSWHIWVVNYNPTPIGAGKFMNLNLGAFSNTSTATVTDISAKGLHYQWGRKDPFPSSTTLNGNAEPTLYTATGTTDVTNTQVAVANNFANSVANPTTFYNSMSDPYDWYTNSTSTQNNALWGPASKTVHDPCPDGWRVPQHGVWTGLTTTNFPWGNYGRTAASHGGFYPAAGCRYYTGVALGNTGTYGYYWSATAYGYYGYYLNLSSSNVSTNTHTFRAYGFSVRCVQE